VDVGIAGSRGRQKRRLEIEPAEAETVHKIFDLYLHGLDGHSMGMKTLTTHLNDQGYTVRGRPWRMQKVDDVLSDRVYMGEFYFNRHEWRTAKIGSFEFRVG
ncbi:MAG: hypothetical protein DI537_55660, partial [Stutzerimonas stutzeri]